MLKVVKKRENSKDEGEFRVVFLGGFTESTTCLLLLFASQCRTGLCYFHAVGRLSTCKLKAQFSCQKY